MREGSKTKAIRRSSERFCQSSASRVSERMVGTLSIACVIGTSDNVKVEKGEERRYNERSDVVPNEMLCHQDARFSQCRWKCIAVANEVPERDGSKDGVIGNKSKCRKQTRLLDGGVERCRRGDCPPINRETRSNDLEPLLLDLLVGYRQSGYRGPCHDRPSYSLRFAAL